jgi:hypothetical protein
MIKIKIADAPPRTIDWLVAYTKVMEANNGRVVQAQDLATIALRNGAAFSTNPAQGQPILEREAIALYPNYIRDASGRYNGWLGSKSYMPGKHNVFAQGPTMLIAGLRCYLCSKLGDFAEVPEELCEQGS